MFTSREVTIEDAAICREGNLKALQRVAVDKLEYHGPESGYYFIHTLNGGIHDTERGQVVVRYGPGDVGVMSEGAFRRFFGDDVWEEISGLGVDFAAGEAYTVFMSETENRNENECCEYGTSGCSVRHGSDDESCQPW